MDQVKAENILFRPLFYDALSGSFEPKSDSLGRRHTLARLAVATFMNGTTIKDRLLSEKAHTVKRYTPSWAPNAEATVTGERIGNQHLIYDVYLDAVDPARIDESLWVEEIEMERDDLNDPVPYGLRVHEWGASTRFTLELGTELSSTQSLIAEKALAIFDKLST